MNAASANLFQRALHWHLLHLIRTLDARGGSSSSKSLCQQVGGERGGAAAKTNWPLDHNRKWGGRGGSLTPPTVQSGRDGPGRRWMGVCREGG